ncbi:hypothetical protein G9A89_009208 [Geosiphon pyriformis]|nr:hypothetical protein G9A89_009208 [Geosiphon pyriformis]
MTTTDSTEVLSKIQEDRISIFFRSLEYDTSSQNIHKGLLNLIEAHSKTTDSAFMELLLKFPTSKNTLVLLGLFYEHSQEPGTRDLDKAKAAYERATILTPQNPYAHFLLGRFHFFGSGNEQRFPKAFESFYRAAFEFNLSPGYCFLGHFYMHGMGVEVNKLRGFWYYYKAAALGNAEGYFMTGFSYREGRGTMADVHRALRWYRNGVQGYNDKWAVNALKRVFRKNMSLTLGW